MNNGESARKSGPQATARAFRTHRRSRAAAAACIVVGVVVVMALFGVVWAAPAPAGAPGKGKGGGATPDTDFNVKITAQNLRYDDKNHFLTLDGNVVFTHLDTVITCPHAEFQTDKQIGHCTGGVRITQPGTTITGSRLDAFYFERRAVVTGQVQVVSEKGGKASEPGKPSEPGKASPSPKAAAAGGGGGKLASPRPALAKSLPTVMLTDELQYFWEKQEADAIGNVKVRQGDKRSFCDRAHYDANAHLIHMYSNVRYERGDRDWMVCEEGTLNTETNVFVATGGVEVTVFPNQAASASAAPTASPRPQGDRILKPPPPVVQPVHIPDGMPQDAIPPARDIPGPSAPRPSSGPR